MLNCQGSGDDNRTAEAIDWVTQNAQRPAVANMSLGAIGSHAGMETAVRNAVAAGITFALAAGNNNGNACNFTPAREPSALTVAASEMNDAKASFSNVLAANPQATPQQIRGHAGTERDVGADRQPGQRLAEPLAFRGRCRTRPDTDGAADHDPADDPADHAAG